MVGVPTQIKTTSELITASFKFLEKLNLVSKIITSFILFLLFCAVFTAQTSQASNYNPLLYEFNSIIIRYDEKHQLNVR